MPAALYVLGPAALLAVAADVTRAFSSAFNAVIRSIFGALMRAEELPAVRTGVRFNGATCVLVGAALMVLVFPLRVAVPVLIMSMLADAAAALVGRRWGHHPWGSLSATVEGTAAFVAVGLGVMTLVPSIPWGPAVAGVGIAALVEALPLPINDNIRVPVAAALAVLGVEALFLGRSVSLLPLLTA
jgi:dolichol kinase